MGKKKLLFVCLLLLLIILLSSCEGYNPPSNVSSVPVNTERGKQKPLEDFDSFGSSNVTDVGEGRKVKLFERNYFSLDPMEDMEEWLNQNNIIKIISITITPLSGNSGDYVMAVVYVDTPTP